MSESRSILITGSNSGLGRMMAEALAERGHIVLASMRQVAGKNAEAAGALRAWAESTGAKLHVVELDVSDDGSVARAVQHALATAGRIDVVVNNAAFGVLGLLEAYTPAQLQQLFEVNVCGAQRVNRAVLPHMRERRSGLLVQVSSTVGRMVLPAMGPYCMTKWALEAMAEVYRYELAPVGVDSIIVQPGTYPTEFLAKAMAPADLARAQDYGVSAQAPQIIQAGFDSIMGMPEPPDPREVADAVTRLIEMPAGTRPLRTVVDRLMGQGTVAINEVASNVMAGVLQALGMGAMLGPQS
jgi:NAD(P)-dependent dehydrogenase (short-subunit alcohol dehydrogenase family)